MTQLHDEDAPDLGDSDIFLQELRARFKDESQTQQAEAEIQEIKQKSHPAKEYIREFRRLDGKLQHWPERLLVYFFKEVVDPELFPTCVCRGVPERIHNWYRMAVAMDLELNRHKKRGSAKKKPKSQTKKGQLGHWASPRQAEEQPKGTSGQPIKCFH